MWRLWLLLCFAWWTLCLGIGSQPGQNKVFWLVLSFAGVAFWGVVHYVPSSRPPLRSLLRFALVPISIYLFIRFIHWAWFTEIPFP
jgi:hypothetical protein